MPTLSPALLPYLMLFGVMLAGNGWVLVRLFPRGHAPPTLATATLAIGILLMGAGLWSALIFAVLDPGDASVVSVFLALNSMMAVAGCWALSLFWGAEEHQLPSGGWLWPVLVAVLVVGNEALMGAAFTLALAGPPSTTTGGLAALGAVTTLAIGSVWFFGAMFANMLLVALWVRDDGPTRTLFVGLALSAAAGPWVILNPPAGAVLMAILMAGVLGFALRTMRRGNASPGFLRTALAVWIGFTGMSIGALLDSISPRPLAVPGLSFAIATLLVMLGEFTVLTRWGLAPATEREIATTLGAGPSSTPAKATPAPP